MMKMRSVVLLLILGGMLSAQASVAIVREKADTQWFSDAGFGMFIHFGLYSIPAGEWNGEKMGRNWYAEWIRMQQGFPNLNAEGGVGIPRAAYDTLLDQFNPTQFDADEWIRLAKEAGMKYFLITAKHHDGFALWPSQASAYNVVDATPFKRDVLGELAKACKKYGVELGFYYSHWQDWGNHGGAMPPWPRLKADGTPRENEPTVKQPSDQEFQTYWDEIAIPQTIELIRSYKPRLMWFDNWRETSPLTAKRLEQLIEVVRTEDPTILINSRIGVTWNHPRGDELVDYKSMADNQVPKTGADMPWETSGTMQRSWGYHKLDPEWKPTKQLLEHLIDCVSRGGNFQLNVGPMGDGRFPNEAITRLKDIGAWMKVNGEAIHGTHPVNVNEPKWGRLTAKQHDSRYRVYMHVYERPKDGILPITKLERLPTKAFLLQSGSELNVTRNPKGIDVELPSEMSIDEPVAVVVLEYPKDPLAEK